MALLKGLSPKVTLACLPVDFGNVGQLGRGVENIFCKSRQRRHAGFVRKVFGKLATFTKRYGI